MHSLTGSHLRFIFFFSPLVSWKIINNFLEQISVDKRTNFLLELGQRFTLQRYCSSFPPSYAFRPAHSVFSIGFQGVRVRPKPSNVSAHPPLLHIDPVHGCCQARYGTALATQSSCEDALASFLLWKVGQIVTVHFLCKITKDSNVKNPSTDRNNELNFSNLTLRQFCCHAKLSLISRRISRILAQSCCRPSVKRPIATAKIWASAANLLCGWGFFFQVPAKPSRFRSQETCMLCSVCFRLN